jgi:hypothetical protein
MCWFLHTQIILQYVIHMCQFQICGYKQFKDLDAITHLQNFTFCSPSSLSKIMQGVNNKKLRFCFVYIYEVCFAAYNKSRVIKQVGGLSLFTIWEDLYSHLPLV